MRALRRSTIAVCLLAAVALAITGQGKHRSIRKVAVLSVTGPSRLDAAGQHTSLQDAINHSETSLVKTLSAKGLRVISLADTKMFADANWEAAYSNSLRDDSKPRLRAEHQSASSNTLVLQDLLLAETPSSGRAYSTAFCRTAGELARQMGADGAVLLTMSPSLDSHGPPTVQQVIQILMIGQTGKTIFRQESKVAKSFDARQLSVAINEATDEGIRMALEPYAVK
jgi:hypothetical protein